MQPQSSEPSILSHIFGIVFGAHKANHPAPSLEPEKHVPYEEHTSLVPALGLRNALFF
jgi:hypothetical protein